MTKEQKMDITVDTYYAVGTYAGVILGSPSAAWAIASAKSEIEHMWGKDRPVYVVTADINDNGQLPKWKHIAWLVSNECPEDAPEADGSHLFVVWFSDNPPGKENLDDVASKVDWKKHAKAYWI